MNKKLICSLLIGSAIGFTGCSDDEIVEQHIYPISNSEDIGIGGNASYGQNKTSRTIYTGNESQDGSVEYINWINGSEGYGDTWVADEILIYSPQAACPDGKHFASYKINSNQSGTAENVAATGHPLMFSSMNTWYADNNIKAENQFHQPGVDVGSFTVTDAPAGLRWTKGVEIAQHTFYAAYPSPKLNQSVKLYEEGGSVWFEGIISSNQHTKGFMLDPKTTPNPLGTNTFIAQPIMRQNYMFAVHTATESDVTNNSIGLSFRTLPTVVEAEFIWPDNSEASNYIAQGVMLTTTEENVQLAGKFRAQLDPKGGYPLQIVPVQEGTSQKSVYVDLDSDLGDGVPGVRLNGGDRLKVRFILLPNKELDASKLKLSVIATKDVQSTENGKTETITVKGLKSHFIVDPKGGSNMTAIQPHKLNKIANIKMPFNMAGTNWLSLLDDNILLSQLSIPGTGNSYINPKRTPLSGGGSNGWAENERAQVLGIKDQWNMGVRCFELSLDAIEEDGKGMKDKEIRIDNTMTTSGVTFGSELEKLLTDLETNKGEFAMVIVRYQPGNEGRSSQRFVNMFKTYLTDVSATHPGKFCVFNPNTTLKEARGKILFVLCPTSEGEDVMGSITTGGTPDFQTLPYLMIDGCGSLPDKFHKRGYTHNGFPVVADCANSAGADVDNTAEHFMTRNLIGQLKAGEADFTYHTNQGFDAYCQEWTRVIGGTGVVYGTSNLNDKEYAWLASYEEKLTHAKETFSKAVNDKTGKMVYLNSLCGFLVTNENTPSSSSLYQPISDGQWPSLRGNIQAFSQKMNFDFYKYMHDALTGGKVKGPMGIVLMNRVGETGIPGNGPLVMPNMVIMNNFSFPMKTQGSGNTTKALSNAPVGAGGEVNAANWEW